MTGFFSVFCGWLSYLLKVQEELCGILAGVAGWGGTRAIRLAEVVIQKRLGVDGEDLK